MVASLSVSVLAAGLLLPSPAQASDPSGGALACSGDLAGTQPVLLVHGTGVTPTENWSWNYAIDLPKRTRTDGVRFSVCTVRLPDRALNDIQESAPYVVDAVTRMHAASGTKISILGHSQGGLVPRWALRWWPELRPMVDDVITLGAPHHGTVVAERTGPFSCEACWQMRTDSQFIAALNSWDETPGDISYTSIYTRFDELVQPAESAVLDTGASGTNSFSIAVQDVGLACSTRPTDHAGLAGDAVAHVLVLGALNNRRTSAHEGTAAGVVVPPTACMTASFSTMPTPAEWQALTAAWIANLDSFPEGGRPATAEPEPAPYVRETSVAATAPAVVTATDAVDVRATVTDRGGRPLVGVPVTFDLGGGHAEAVTGADGVALASVIADADAGPASVIARSAGDGWHSPATSAVAVEVVREAAVATYTGQTAARGSSVAVGATLTDDEGDPVVGRVVTFSALGASTSATTDGAGRAAATLSVPDHGAAAQVTASFAGDARYSAATTASQVRWGRG